MAAIRSAKIGPISEIDWGEIFFGRTRRPGDNEPDPEGELMGIDLLVKRYQAPYDDWERRDWIERRLRKWWSDRSLS